MISMVSARRRAEEFASLVDAAPDKAAESSYADLVALVSEMRAVPAPAPRPEFVATLRERLMVEAETALVPADSRLEITRPTVHRRDRRVAAVVGVAALLGAGTSVAVAAQGSLPGDTLYPIKRALESAETSFEAGDAAKAASMFARASQRLVELESLAREDGSPGAMSDTLADFITESSQGADLLFSAYEASGDPARVHELREFATASLEKLAELKPQLPAELQPMVDNAVTTLLAFDARAVDACPSCGGPLDLPVSLVAADSGTARPVVPPLAPPTTIQQDSGPEAALGSEDPVQALLDGLPVLGPALPEVTPKDTKAGAQGDAGTKSGSGPLDSGGAVEPVEKLTDPLLGEEGLVGGGEALDGLLGGLVDPLLGTGSLGDDTLGTDGLLK